MNVYIKNNIIKDWYGHIISFAKEKLKIIIWVESTLIGIIVIILQEFPKPININNYANNFIWILLIGSSCLITVNIIDNIIKWAKNKIYKANQKRLNKVRASKINKFIKEFDDGYDSQDKCLAWGNKVLPNIKFDKECYDNFKSDLNSIVYLGSMEEKLLSLQRKLKRYLLRLLEQLQYSSKN